MIHRIDRQDEARRILARRKPPSRTPRTILRTAAVACGLGTLAGVGQRLPALIVVGAMRAGTTSLFSFLVGHPQIAASFRKEVHYFDLHFHRGTSWYRSQFRRPRAGTSGCVVGVESSPYYMFDPRVPGRMAALVPDGRLVFLLRDPVERAFSHYRKNRRDGREPLTFAEALDAEEERLAGEEERMLHDPTYLSGLHQYYSYAARGRYAEQLIRWRQHFPSEQMLVVDSGRLFASPAEVLNEVLSFAGLEPWAPKQFNPLNAARFETPLDPRVASALAATFSAHEQRLAGLIGWCPSAMTARIPTAATPAEAA